MENEKCQDIDRARGLDEIACDPPMTPPPVNQPSSFKNTIVLHPHR